MGGREPRLGLTAQTPAPQMPPGMCCYWFLGSRCQEASVWGSRASCCTGCPSSEVPCACRTPEPGDSLLQWKCIERGAQARRTVPSLSLRTLMGKYRRQQTPVPPQTELCGAWGLAESDNEPNGSPPPGLHRELLSVPFTFAVPLGPLRDHKRKVISTDRGQSLQSCHGPSQRHARTGFHPGREPGSSSVVGLFLSMSDLPVCTAGPRGWCGLRWGRPVGSREGGGDTAAAPQRNHPAGNPSPEKEPSVELPSLHPRLQPTSSRAS